MLCANSAGEPVHPVRPVRHAPQSDGWLPWCSPHSEPHASCPGERTGTVTDLPASATTCVARPPPGGAGRVAVGMPSFCSRVGIGRTVPHPPQCYLYRTRDNPPPCALAGCPHRARTPRIRCPRRQSGRSSASTMRLPDEMAASDVTMTRLNATASSTGETDRLSSPPPRLRSRSSGGVRCLPGVWRRSWGPVGRFGTSIYWKTTRSFLTPDKTRASPAGTGNAQGPHGIWGGFLDVPHPRPRRVGGDLEVRSQLEAMYWRLPSSRVRSRPISTRHDDPRPFLASCRFPPLSEGAAAGRLDGVCPRTGRGACRPTPFA